MIDDDRALEEAANAPVSRNRKKRAIIINTRGYPHGNAWRFTGWFDQCLGWLRKQGVPVNYELLFFLMSKCKPAEIVDVSRHQLATPPPEGQRAVCLVGVGCRARVTREEIATRLKMHPSTVSEHMSVLKEHGIIVNWGEGWVEFAAIYVWSGSESLRQAYADQQPCDPSQSMIFLD
jgi:DNA-binding transcriptional ArsR family regulator